jgi:hypothetical protein
MVDSRSKRRACGRNARDGLRCGRDADFFKVIRTMATSVLAPILNDDALTRGLADPEARILVEWLVERAEGIARMKSAAELAHAEVQRLCRRARSIGRFVSLWSRDSRGAACQLAATERFHWPLPASDVDPCDLMQAILDWEGSHGNT